MIGSSVHRDIGTLNRLIARIGQLPPHSQYWGPPDPVIGTLAWSRHVACRLGVSSTVVRAVVQRVRRCQVWVSGRIVGQIGSGLLVFLGVGKSDTEAAADYLAEKITGLRIFEDETGKMNLSALDKRAELLVVSQFTLYGDVRRGRRPAFDAAARPEEARRLYEYFVAKVRATGLRCETGEFQAMMEVELVNDGPVTVMLDSEKIF